MIRPFSRPVRHATGLTALAAMLLALSSPLQAATWRLDAPDEIHRVLAPYLPEDIGSPRRLQQRLADMLATEGYFSPQFDFGTDRDTGEPDNVVHLDPGPRTLITAVDLTVDGPLAEKTRADLIAGWQLPPGHPFRQDDWNEAKQQVLNALLASEYADARLLDSEALIDTESQRATLRLHYDSGPRYRYGELQVHGLAAHDPALIDRYNRSVRPGTLYSEEGLNTLQSTLRSTPYFTSVQATLDKEAATDNPDGTRTAPVRIDLRERAPQRLGFGVGASSNTGARVEANYQHVDFLNQSLEFSSGLRLEQKKQTAYADLLFPPDDRQRRNSLGGMLENTDIAGLKTSRYALGAQRVQQRGSVEQRLSLQWEHEERTPDASNPVISRALAPNIQWTWRHVDSLLAPRQGTVLQTQVGGGARGLLSDQNFVRLHGRIQQYFPLGQHDTLLLRAEGGRTFATSREHIPQDYLFRAGGSGSVRGYAYQSLGLQQGATTLGGRYLAVISAEATHWLDERWGVAAFVDAGDAVDSWQDARLAVGYGLGARWKSPAGPLGVDLAYGERTHRMQLHFALAIPF